MRANDTAGAGGAGAGAGGAGGSVAGGDTASALAAARRIVVKIGSSLLIDPAGYVFDSRTGVLVDGAVITLVDAKHANHQLDEHEVVQRQVGFADRLFITKSDLVDQKHLDDLRHRLGHGHHALEGADDLPCGHRHHLRVLRGGDPLMLRRIRGHANFAEYTPLALVLITLLELAGEPRWELHALGASLLAGRLEGDRRHRRRQLLCAAR